MSYQEDKLKGIANAIRTKSGVEDLFSADEFEQRILDIPSGGGLELQDAILDGSATEIYTEAEAVVDHALRDRKALKSFAGPDVKTIGANGLYGCSSLTTLDLPACTSIGVTGLYNCSSLTTLDLPVCTSIGANGLASCSKLTTLDLPVCTSIGATGLASCSKLTTLILRSPTEVTLSNVNAFNNTPIASGTGYVYVPAALVASYKAATNWITFASQIRAIEAYPEITGGAS